MAAIVNIQLGVLLCIYGENFPRIIETLLKQ